MKKKAVSLLLILALVLGLAVPALAAGQTFTDVPSSYWGYADIEAVAEAGLMKGTGGNQFSPEVKVSVAQFLTLLGRLVFPDVKAEGVDWYGPYVTAAKEAKLLDGTQVDTNNVEAEISRYDMAVILRAAAKRLGVAEKVAQSSEVKDYLDIPTRYADSVLAVYGMGLIRGDQAGNFNGSNTMMRAEVATVIMRLAKAKPSGTVTPGTDPEKPTESVDDPLVQYEFRADLRRTEYAMGAPAYDKHIYLPNVSAKLYYTPDGGKTSTLVAEGVSAAEDRRIDETHREFEGGVTFQFEAPESWGSWGRDRNFYVSAETVYEGQKLVTSDLRTDGREYKSLFAINPVAKQSTPGVQHGYVELTPPTGEKAKFTYQGHILTGIIGDVDKMPLPNFAIQLHLADGRVVAETVSKEDGYFSMECEVDALDGGFDSKSNLYYVTASGYFQNELYVKNGKYSNKDEEALALHSLIDLGVYENGGIRLEQNPDDHVYIYWDYRKDS